MSLPAQNVAPQVVAAPGQVTFNFAWRCDDAALIKVWVNDVLDGGFTSLLNADQTAAPGGSITRGIACFGGEVVTVERASPLSQLTNFLRYGAFQGAAVTNILDKLVMLVQELSAIVVPRCVRMARSALSKMTSLEIAAPANNKVIGFITDPNDPTKLITTVYDATLLAENNPAQPPSWTPSTAVAATVFVIAGATQLSSHRYLVTIDGVVQSPDTYTITPNTITFIAGQVPAGTKLVIRGFVPTGNVP
jgi:hypothetical protein